MTLDRKLYKIEITGDDDMYKSYLDFDELEEIILSALEKNGVDTHKISHWKIGRVLVYYRELCEWYSSVIKGEFYTFKKAACLMVSINRSKLCSRQYSYFTTPNLYNKNANVAIDAALKMCENPIYMEKHLESVNFDEVMQEKLLDDGTFYPDDNSMDELDDNRYQLYCCLYYMALNLRKQSTDIVPLSIILELLYKEALNKKEKVKRKTFSE